MADALLYYRGNSARLQVTLKNEDTGQFINNANFVRLVELKHQDGSNVTGMSLPATLSYVSGSNGQYRTTLEDDLAVTELEQLYAKIEYDAGPGMKGVIEPDIIVRRRRGN